MPQIDGRRQLCNVCSASVTVRNAATSPVDEAAPAGVLRPLRSSPERELYDRQINPLLITMTGNLNCRLTRSRVPPPSPPLLRRYLRSNRICGRPAYPSRTAISGFLHHPAELSRRFLTRWTPPRGASVHTAVIRICTCAVPLRQ